MFGNGIGFEKTETKNNGVSSITVEEISKKMDSLKKWTVSTALMTKQFIGEKLGRRNAITTDPELEAQIKFLFSTHERHKNLLRQFTDLLNIFVSMASTQFSAAAALNNIIEAEGAEDYDMKTSLATCKHTLSNAGNNTDLVCKILNHVVDEVQTLCSQTMQDSIATAKSLEHARLAYDSTIMDYEKMRPKIVPGSPQSIQLEENLKTQQEEYQQKKDKLTVKLRFLESNKVHVMKHQLKILSNSIVAYYQGNGTTLNDILKDLAPPPLGFS